MSHTPPAKEEVAQQIHRLINSDLFRSSEVQRRLLTYLADKSLAGEADQLKEYTIGVEGIGRPSTYDPRRDSTVRLQIGKLRQKIAEYYLTAGQDDPVRIDLPKGRFRLIFSGPEPDDAGDERSRWRATAVAMAVGLVLMVALCAWLGANLARSKSYGPATALSPALEEFWGPLADNKRPTLICVGTPMFVKLKQGLLLRDPTVNTWNAARSSGLIDGLQKTYPGSAPEPWYVFTTVGEAEGAFRLGKALAQRMPDLQLARSTELSWEQIGSENVVFLGPNRFNQQISALPVLQDFAVEAFGVRNLRPQPGEPALFEDSDVSRSGVAYALVSRLPGLHRDGLAIVLAGAGIPGTLAATEVATSERYAAEMLKRIRLPSGRLPTYYQVVIRCKFNDWLPVEISYVVHHILSPA